MFKNSKKGVSLYLALMIMFILLAIGLGVSLIIVSQMKMMKGMGDSVVAFYAADTGIEHAMYNIRVESEDGGVSGTLSMGGETANYNVTSYFPGENRWDSKGSFKGVKRAIEITIPSTPPPPPNTYTQNCDGDCGDAPCVSAGKSCDPGNPSLTCSKSTGDCSIPTPPYCPDPLPNSYSTGGTCSCHAVGTLCAVECDFGACVDSTACNKTGNCTYACDDGYTWNGTACVP